MRARRWAADRATRRSGARRIDIYRQIRRDTRSRQRRGAVANETRARGRRRALGVETAAAMQTTTRFRLVGLWRCRIACFGAFDRAAAYPPALGTYSVSCPPWWLRRSPGTCLNILTSLRQMPDACLNILASRSLRTPTCSKPAGHESAYALPYRHSGQFMNEGNYDSTPSGPK